MSCILLAFDFALMYSCHETYSLDFCMLCALHVNFYSTARVIVHNIRIEHAKISNQGGNVKIECIHSISVVPFYFVTSAECGEE